MASQAQILANRRNAQKSTGPKSAEGKASVARNAYRHGLCAEKIIAEPDRRGEFNAFTAKLMRELNPRSPLQQVVAERAVILAWKLSHVREVEAELVAREFVALRDSYPDDYKTQASAETWHLINEGGENRRVNPFSTLRRYEASIERSFYRSLKELKLLQEQSQFEEEEEEPIAAEVEVADAIDVGRDGSPAESPESNKGDETDGGTSVPPYSNSETAEQSQSGSRAVVSRRKPKKDFRLEFMEQLDEVEAKLLERIQKGRLTDGLHLWPPGMKTKRKQFVTSD